MKDYSINEGIVIYNSRLKVGPQLSIMVLHLYVNFVIFPENVQFQLSATDKVNDFKFCRSLAGMDQIFIPLKGFYRFLLKSQNLQGVSDKLPLNFGADDQ